MSDDIYLVYYNNSLIGILSDSESFWYLYEWLSESDGVCNVVTVSKDQITMPEDLKFFTRFTSKYGEVTASRTIMNIDYDYDDNLI